MTEGAGPTARVKRDKEHALTTFLCLLDDGILKYIRDCTVAESHRAKIDSSLDKTVDDLKALITLVYVHGTQGGKSVDSVSQLGLCIFQGDHVPK